MGYQKVNRTYLQLLGTRNNKNWIKEIPLISWLGIVKIFVLTNLHDKRIMDAMKMTLRNSVVCKRLLSYAIHKYAKSARHSFTKEKLYNTVPGDYLWLYLATIPYRGFKIIRTNDKHSIHKNFQSWFGSFLNTVKRFKGIDKKLLISNFFP